MHVSLSLPVSISLSNTPSPTHSLSLSLLGVVSTMTPVEHRLRQILVPEMLATDIAEYLVRKGLPFRETHHIAGNYHSADLFSLWFLFSFYMYQHFRFSFFIYHYFYNYLCHHITPTLHFHPNKIDSLSHLNHLQFYLLHLGAAVKLAENKGIPLDKLSLEDLQTLDPKFEADVMNLWSYENR